MIIDKGRFDKGLENFYSSKKQKNYYNSKEIRKLTGISERTLRYRIKEVKEKYINVPALIFKKNNKWKIHYALVDEFQPIYTPRKITLTNYGWKSFITWCTIDRYDIEYHKQLIYELESACPNNEFYATIEKTKNDVNHVHIVSDADKDMVKDIIDNILSNYISTKSYRLEVTDLIKKAQAVNYLRK